MTAGSIRGPVLVLDLGGTWTRTAVVDSSGAVHSRRQERTPVGEGPGAVVDACVALLEAALGAWRLEGGEAPQAIGISSPGPVDPVRGIVLNPPNMGPHGFIDVPLADRLGQALGLPAFLDRDTQVAALGEGAFGAARGLTDFVYVTISTGVGGGVVSDGRLLRGPDGTAGELGHLCVDWDGPPCGCGSRGHLEAIASGTGIARRARAAAADQRSPALEAAVRRHGDAFSAVDVAAAADAGDPVAQGLFADARRAFAVACVTIVNLFNPDLIVVGGGLARAEGDRLLQPARDAVAGEAFRAPGLRARIEPALLGDDVSLVGAAVLVRERTGDDA
jgi:glucokinase